MDTTLIDVRVSWKDQFKSSLQGRSEKTVKAYLSDLGIFERWFSVENATVFIPELLTSYDLGAFRRYALDVEQVSPATWNRRRISLIVFAQWCRDQGHISYDPTDELKAQEQVQLAPRWLAAKDFGLFMRMVERQVNAGKSTLARRQALRDQAVVGLMVYAGLREGEVCGLAVDDVELGERSGRVVVRHGKGDKARVIPLNEQARKALRLWMDVRGAQDGPLFIGKGAVGLGTRGVQRRVAELGRLAGVEVTPHQLRHTFAKRVLDKGTPLTVVSKLLGHSRLEITARYVQPGWEDFEQAVGRI